MSYQVKTPILFLAFNRPDCTERVFDSIRKVKPSKLYVAIDGPRENRTDDFENRDRVINIVKNVDWECETHYLIHEKNLGCSLSGVTAWRWFFEHEERMLFIEDDGLGDEDAFRYMDAMLERYKDDNRIINVGAVNYGPKFGNATYFFTRQPASTYFMGTWKRVMDKYDYDLESYQSIRNKNKFRKRFITIGEYLVSISNFDNYIKHLKQGNRENTYDLQLQYLAYKLDMYSINPNVNLVSNIGFDAGSNTNFSKDNPMYKEYANRERYPLGDIVFADFVIDRQFEKRFFNKKVLMNQSWYRLWLSAVTPDWLKTPIRLIRKLKK